MTIRTDFDAPRVPQPPAHGAPPETWQLWLTQVAVALNGIPQLSAFSYSTPESNVSAVPGTVGVNYDPAASSRFWVKDTGYGNTGWSTGAASAPPASHVLATTAGLGAQHTVSGLTSGQALVASGATAAAFRALTAADIAAGTFPGASYQMAALTLTGLATVRDGTSATALGWRFTTENTGMYLSAANTMAFVVNDVIQMRIFGTTNLLYFNTLRMAAADGTAAEPAYHFAAGGTDGLYRIGGGGVGVTAGGVLRLSILTTGITTAVLVSANAGLTVASGQTLTVTGATITGLTAASVGAGTFPGLVTAGAGLTVSSGQTLTVTGATITGLTAASVGAGTFPAGTFAFAAESHLSFGNITTAVKIKIGSAGLVFRDSSDAATVFTMADSGPTANLDMDTASGKVYKVNGTQVVSARGAAVADASGGAVVDAEARTAINTLLARCRTHGLIAT